MSFVILVDKQEKHNYVFSEGTEIEVVSLKTGDYSLLNFENSISIERKSLDDFCSSVTSKHERFFKEIKRMQKFDFACIVVEGQIEEILKHLYDSPASPETIIGNLVSITIDYGIPVYLCSDRQHALYLTEKILRMYYEHRTKNSSAPQTSFKKKRTVSKKKIKSELL